MEPIKSLVPLAKWMLRVSLLVFVYVRYYETVMAFSFDSRSFYIALDMIVMSILLFVGGFFSSATLTVISGALIFLISVAQMFLGGISVDLMLSYFIPASLGFYFLARGNKG
jgi:hypothetical protein